MCALFPVLESHTKAEIITALLDLIPPVFPEHLDKQKGRFTRTRKLPFPKLVTSILSLVANGNPHGVDVHLGQFFRGACRSGLWPDARAPHRSAVSE